MKTQLAGIGAVPTPNARRIPGIHRRRTENGARSSAANIRWIEGNLLCRQVKDINDVL